MSMCIRGVGHREEFYTAFRPTARSRAAENKAYIVPVPKIAAHTTTLLPCRTMAWILITHAFHRHSALQFWSPDYTAVGIWQLCVVWRMVLVNYSHSLARCRDETNRQIDSTRVERGWRFLRNFPAFIFLYEYM